jgi:hypothetical protein
VERPAVAAWLRRLPTWRLDAGDAPHRAARLLEALVAVRQTVARRHRSLGDGGQAPPFTASVGER